MVQLNSTSQEQVTQNLLKIAYNAVVQATQSCNASNVSNQIISVNADGDVYITGVNLSNNSSINTKCVAQLQTDVTINNTIKQDLEAYADNQTKQQLAGAAASVNETFQKTIQQNTTDLQTNLSMANLQTCISNNDATQQLLVSAGGNATLSDINFQISQQIVTDCFMESKQNAASFNNIATAIAATTNNATVQGSDLAAILQALIIPLIIVACVFLFFILGGTRLIKSGVKGVGNTVKSAGSLVGKSVSTLGGAVGDVIIN